MKMIPFTHQTAKSPNIKTQLWSGLRNLTGVKVLNNGALTPEPFKGAGQKTDGGNGRKTVLLTEYISSKEKPAKKCIKKCLHQKTKDSAKAHP